MSRSLSLAAYRALQKRTPAQDYVPVQSRSGREVIWAHATTTDRVEALAGLGARLAAQRPGVQMVITIPSELQGEFDTRHRSAPCELLPPDHSRTVTQFLDYWRPDICLWAGGLLRPNAILAAAERDIPLALIDADADGFDSLQDRWLPELSRRILGKFHHVSARSIRAKQRLMRFGLTADDVHLTTQLQPEGIPPDCADSDVDYVTSHLGGRPAWLAAHVQPDEVSAVLRAHRGAARLAHRLLLILYPADAAQSDAIETAARDQKMRYRRWQGGTMPDESTQVLIADVPDEIGLWYRVAPVSFLASSLVSGIGGHNPFDAAALGSAVLYGPHVGKHLHAYTRLTNAGAARIVNDAQALGTAVAHLIAPDQAAKMATAGWQVVSEAAELIDQIIDLVQDTLDERGTP